MLKVWRTIHRIGRRAPAGLVYLTEAPIRLAIGFVGTVIVARYLGPSTFGELSTVIAVFALLTPVVALGLPALLVRDLAVESDVANRRAKLRAVVLVQLGALLAVAGIGVPLAVTFGATQTAVAVAAAPVLALGLAQTLRSLWEVEGRPLLVVGATAIASLTGLGGRVALVLVEGPLWAFAGMASIEALVIVGILSRKASSIGSFVEVRRAWGVVRPSLREAAPLLAASVAIAIYMRIDIVMLSRLVSTESAGFYSVAARLSEMWYFIPVALMAARRPEFSRWFASGDESVYRRMLTLHFRKVAVLGWLAVGIGVLVLPTVIVPLYGEPYLASVDVLRIHVLAIPFVFVSVHSWLIDRGLAQVAMANTLVGAGVNVALNLALIPVLGMHGAAWATVCSYAVSGVLLNGLRNRTRPLFGMQARALLRPWGREL